MTTNQLFENAAPEDKPYALRSEGERTRRAGMLSELHMAPLTDYLKEIRNAHPDKKIPNFDPCDGGIHARALFLLEAPGPQAISPAARVKGSGFVSRNNPDPTAKNLCTFMREVNLAREDTLIWNIVPWYVGLPNGTKVLPVSPKDKQDARPHLKPLLDLLPALQVIVLMGKKAQSEAQWIKLQTNTPLTETYHTSSQVINVWPEKKREVQECLREVAALISGKGENS